CLPNRKKRVECWVETFDPMKRVVHYLHRRDLAPGDGTRDFARGSFHHRHGALNSHPNRYRRLMLPTKRVAETPATFPRLLTKCTRAFGSRSTPATVIAVAPTPKRMVCSLVPTRMNG